MMLGLQMEPEEIEQHRTQHQTQGDSSHTCKRMEKKREKRSARRDGGLGGKVPGILNIPGDGVEVGDERPRLAHF